MVVDLHACLCVYVLGADDLTVPLQRLQLEELGCRQELKKIVLLGGLITVLYFFCLLFLLIIGSSENLEQNLKFDLNWFNDLHDISVPDVQSLCPSKVEILHDELPNGDKHSMNY